MVEPDTDICECKIGKAISTYSLDHLNERLISERKSNDRSLRDLKDIVNKEILRAEIQGSVELSEKLLEISSGGNITDNIYKTLTNDNVDPDERARLRTRLSQTDINISSIESSWVTHPTVRTHLNQCLGVDTSQDVDLTPQEAIDTIEWTRTQSQKVTEQTLDRLHSAGQLNTDKYGVTIQIRVSCPDCNQTYRPDELIRQRRCQCEEAHPE